MRNENVYGPRTAEFDPDRYSMLEKEGRIFPKPEELAFGFGRRFVNCSTTADLDSSDFRLPNVVGFARGGTLLSTQCS